MLADTNQNIKHERVWDPLVRLFHWSLVAAFATAWWGKGEAWIHEGAGEIVLILIICRAVWGIIGTGAARFENFIHGPKSVTRYLVSILLSKPKHYVGHNPAGAAMIGLMLLTLAVTTTSGILMSTTALWGNPSMERIHGAAAYAMLFLIAGHLLGVLAAALQHRENLVLSMITGKKWVPADTAPYLGTVKLGDKRVFLAVAMVITAAGIWQGSTSILNASVWRMHKTVAAELVKLDCADATVQMPGIQVYPTVAVNYVIASQALSEFEVFTLTAQQALEKRPTVDFSAIRKWCDDLRSGLARKDTNIAAEATASLASIDTEEIEAPTTVIPATDIPLPEFPALAMSAPDFSHSLDLPEPAPVPLRKMSSATEAISRMGIDPVAFLPISVEVSRTAADVTEQRQSVVPKKPATKIVKVKLVNPETIPVEKRKRVVAKKRLRRSISQVTDNDSRENGSTRTSSGSTDRGTKRGSDGNTGSTGDTTKGISGSGYSNGGSSGGASSGNGSSGSGSKGNSGSRNSGSGSGNSGNSNSGSGSGNSGRGGGDDD
jgi:cytochrome b